MFFHQIPDCQCILKSKGVFRQSRVYRRYDKIYAEWGKGFVRLLSNGGTTMPSVLWDDIEESPHVKFAALGPVYVEPMLPPPRTEDIPKIANLRG